MTSSPTSMSSNNALKSNADVHEWVSSALLQPVCSSIHRWQRFVNDPSPDR